MSDQPELGSAPARASTAGALLRQARQAQGLHIAALAAAIKVVPRKLELLESDQYDQLPDATFTRALAHTVCRTLKIDPSPVLALLPPASGYRLEHVGEGLNTPFRERPGRMEPKDWTTIGTPTLWLVGALIIATGGLYVMPKGWLPFRTQTRATATAPTTSAGSAESPAASDVMTPPAAAASPEPAIQEAPGADASAAPQADSPTAMSPSGVLQLRTTAQSWIEVTDAHGQALIARTVEPGEALGLDGVMPLKVRIGNASATQVVFRGQPLKLASFTRDNVARLELK